MSTEEKITTLRAQVNAATARRARSQVEHDNAIKERDAALAGLSEFGVSTSEEAKALLTSLDEDLASALAEVEDALKETEA